jgi:hypothetical protein
LAEESGGNEREKGEMVPAKRESKEEKRREVRHDSGDINETKWERSQ